ncbi:MAG: D-alanyl-D-alanine carboxypeptidase family protein, partial [Myxococcota bacterium]|nr:D-alanyl-D-alanine carboxypeptidase family protein [Myxococcota bacterium]
FLWLRSNAFHYGFFRPYKGPAALDAKYQETKTAVIEERWHWSYYPVAQAFWELIKRHWQDETTDTEGVTTRVTEGHFDTVFTSAKDLENQPFLPTVSWVKTQLELLHGAIETTIETGAP